MAETMDITDSNTKTDMEQLTDGMQIDDLPVECIEEILKCITDKKDRSATRLVCKSWKILINRNSSNEPYHVYGERNANSRPEDLMERFLTFNWTNLFIDFNDIHFAHTSDFWKQNGYKIVKMNIYSCFNIPLADIIENCFRLREMKIYTKDTDDFNNLMESFDDCLRNRISNTSLKSLTLIIPPWSANKILTVTQKTEILFKRLKNLFFDEHCYVMDHIEELNNGLTQYKFKITLSGSHYGDLNEVVFNSSDSCPISVQKLSIQLFNENDVITLPEKLLRREHYLNLNELRVQYFFFPIAILEGFLSRFAELKSLYVFADVKNPLCQVMKNNLQNLYLCLNYDTLYSQFFNSSFFESFSNLRTLTIDQGSYSDFIGIMKNLTSLEVLQIKDFVPHDAYMTESNDTEILTHQNITELGIPGFFLVENSFSLHKCDKLESLFIYRMHYHKKYQTQMNEIPYLGGDVLKRVLGPQTEKVIFSVWQH